MPSQEYQRVLAYTGLLIFGIGVILFTPFLVLLLKPLTWDDAWPFLAPGGGSMLIGWGLWRALRGADSQYLPTREAAVVMSIGWLLAMVIGGLPFLLGGQLRWLDSLYEAMSGWTGTGLTMFRRVEMVPPIYLLWRSIMEYLGSAGFAVMMLSALIGPEAIGLYQAEARSDHLVPSILDTTRLFMKMYGLYLVMGTILYRLVGMTFFDGLNHAMAALAAGGFSTHSESIGYFDRVSVELVTIFLMLLGSSNFAIHFSLYRTRSWQALRDSEIYALLVLLGILIPLTYLGISIPNGSVTYDSFPHTLRIATFQAISASTTTGFGTADLSKWGDLSLFALTLLMIAGGGTGGTGGGIKLSRLVALSQAVVWAVRHRLFPESVVLRHAVYRQGKLKSISDKELLDVAVVVSLYVLTFLIGTTIFMLHGVPLAKAGLEFSSSLSTVGLSAGITGPTMAPALKITQIAGMWLGRLEFVAVIVALNRLLRDL
jgi:trk system potassium uptake protein TrkH